MGLLILPPSWEIPEDLEGKPVVRGGNGTQKVCNGTEAEATIFSRGSSLYNQTFLGGLQTPPGGWYC